MPLSQSRGSGDYTGASGTQAQDCPPWRPDLYACDLTRVPIDGGVEKGGATLAHQLDPVLTFWQLGPKRTR